MPGDDHTADEDAPLTIEFCARDGRIVVHRDTALGTVTRTIER
jgi:hypothetical protein